MLLTKFKGRQVHFFQMGGYPFYVIRSSRYAAAMCWDENSTAVAVLVPPGMSYKQGAIKAYALLKKGEFAIVNPPLNSHEGLSDTELDVDERGV